MKPFYILYILAFLIVPNKIYAVDDFWGQTGHRVVGEIANTHLNRKAKRKVRRLLNRQSLAFVSTFADEIKSDKRYNEFYTWHYINLSLNESYEESKKNKKGDLVTGINYCKKIIADNTASDEDRAFYLKLLVHLIGDLHQPLHIGLPEDKGGNDHKVQWFNNDSNLHRVWDSEIIENYNMGYQELANNADALTKKEIKSIQKGSVINWVNETHELTKKVYASATLDENLKYKYSYDYLTTVRSQLQIAGIRLARVLNELF